VLATISQGKAGIILLSNPSGKDTCINFSNAVLLRRAHRTNPLANDITSIVARGSEDTNRRLRSLVLLSPHSQSIQPCHRARNKLIHHLASAAFPSSPTANPLLSGCPSSIDKRFIMSLKEEFATRNFSMAFQLTTFFSLDQKLTTDAGIYGQW
jgi:hypothetical protein